MLPTGPSSTPRPQRADARRNVGAILDAAALCLTRNPEASIAESPRSQASAA